MSIYGICALLLVGMAYGMPDRKPPTLAGKCPDLTPFASLDASKITGDWFIVQYGKQGIEKMDSSSDSTKKHCVKKNIVSNPDKGMTSTTTLNKGTKIISVTSTAAAVDGKTGVYTVTTDSDDKAGSITILDTDYTNYLVGVLCKSVGDFHGFTVEILSRQKTLDSSFMDKAKAALDAAKITPDLTAVDQDC